MPKHLRPTEIPLQTWQQLRQPPIHLKANQCATGKLQEELPPLLFLLLHTACALASSMQRMHLAVVLSFRSRWWWQRGWGESQRTQLTKDTGKSGNTIFPGSNLSYTTSYSYVTLNKYFLISKPQSLISKVGIPVPYNRCQSFYKIKIEEKGCCSQSKVIKSKYFPEPENLHDFMAPSSELRAQFPPTYLALNNNNTYQNACYAPSPLLNSGLNHKNSEILM